MQITKVVVFASFFLFAPLSFSVDFFSNAFSIYKRSMIVSGFSSNPGIGFQDSSSNSLLRKNDKGLWNFVNYNSDYSQNRDFRIKMLPVSLWSSVNTDKPWGGNDGALWQGRGLNSQVSAGLELGTDFFLLKLNPIAWASQNLDFEIINTTSSSGYGDYWTVFDNLQRYGQELYWDFSYGESALRFTYKNMTLGFSNESVIIGPGQKNNIILSNNADGFPHFDLGTLSKIDLGKFAEFEFRWLWGFLKESEFFDEDAANDYAWFSGFYASLTPKFFNSFSCGFNYQYYKPLSTWDAYDLLRGIPLLDFSNSATDYKDMMVSLTFQCLFPEVGFELYGEWGRNDNFAATDDLFNSPEHTQAYTVGVNQVLFKNGSNVLFLSLELTNIAQERTAYVRAAGPWYRHSWAGWSQGYTNKGQLLGAAIGPGSGSQWARITWIDESGLISFSAQRISHDKDYYYAIAASVVDSDCFSEFNMALEKVFFLNNVQLYGQLAFIHLWNNNFKYMNNLNNVHLEFGVRYIF